MTRLPPHIIFPYTTLFRSEIRGGEALDIIQAMTSGHGGCMGTLHATYPRDTLTRLETMCMMSDIEMPLTAMRSQIGDRKSTRLNSSHTVISYAVFCVKKKN